MSKKKKRNSSNKIKSGRNIQSVDGPQPVEPILNAPGVLNPKCVAIDGFTELESCSGVWESESSDGSGSPPVTSVSGSESASLSGGSESESASTSDSTSYSESVSDSQSASKSGSGSLSVSFSNSDSGASSGSAVSSSSGVSHSGSSGSSNGSSGSSKSQSSGSPASSGSPGSSGGSSGSSMGSSGSAPSTSVQSSASGGSSGSSSSAKKRTILLLGYWPPTDIGVDQRTFPNPSMPPTGTACAARPHARPIKDSGHGMLWKWGNPAVDAAGLDHRGYNIKAISPTFLAPLGMYPGGTSAFWGRGYGDITVDYETTSVQFWKRIAPQYLPIAIMSFSRTNGSKTWNIAESGKNRKQVDWERSQTFDDFAGVRTTDTLNKPFIGGSATDPSPENGNGVIADNPPDASDATNQPAGSVRNADFGTFVPAMKTAVTNAVAAITATNGGDAGDYVSGFMAYHVAWYREHTNGWAADKKCLYSGHTHVGQCVTPAEGEAAVMAQLDVLIDNLP